MREIKDLSEITQNLHKSLGIIEYNDLYCSMAIPSTINADSIAMEYIQKWFFSKIPKTYFKNIFINGKHVLDDFRDNKINTKLKVVKPYLTIRSELHLDQNRDTLDLYLYGINNYLKKSMFNKKFFNDIKNNMYLSMCLEQFEVQYTFSVKLSTRAQQVDLYKFMQMAYRSGSTQGEYIDMDIHVPYKLMANLARNTGFEVKNDKIINILDFLNYLNTHSLFTFLYKYRTINGKDEFYMRVPDMYMHISNIDTMNLDDGEREGMLNTNFGIEMSVILQMPTPKMYMYYGKTEVETVFPTDDPNNVTAGLYPVTTPEIPKINSKGWGTYLTTDYEEEDLSKPLTIEFEDLFKCDERLWKIIKYNKSMLINNSVFMEIYLYNDGKKIDCTMDWSTLTVTTKENVKSIRTQIILYVDLKYMNDTLSSLDNLNKDRYKISDKQRIE